MNTFLFSPALRHDPLPVAPQDLAFRDQNSEVPGVAKSQFLVKRKIFKVFLNGFGWVHLIILFYLVPLVLREEIPPF